MAARLTAVLVRAARIPPPSSGTQEDEVLVSVPPAAAAMWLMRASAKPQQQPDAQDTTGAVGGSTAGGGGVNLAHLAQSLSTLGSLHSRCSKCLACASGVPCASTAGAGNTVPTPQAALCTPGVKRGRRACDEATPGSNTKRARVAPDASEPSSTSAPTAACACASHGGTPASALRVLLVYALDAMAASELAYSTCVKMSTRAGAPMKLPPEALATLLEYEAVAQCALMAVGAVCAAHPSFLLRDTVSTVLGSALRHPLLGVREAALLWLRDVCAAQQRRAAAAGEAVYEPAAAPSDADTRARSTARASTVTGVRHAATRTPAPDSSAHVTARAEVLGDRDGEASILTGAVQQWLPAIAKLLLTLSPSLADTCLTGYL
ncbi:MAG: hypothetical protein EOO41_02225, partial [Methanobacteriota archaeon]